MAQLQNTFSWSKSRHGKFMECRRLYWFHYYGSWGGWIAEAPPEVRERYILKNLSTRQQWAGKVVHDVLQQALMCIHAGGEIPCGRLIDMAHTTMREQFRASRAGAYRTNPKRYPGLVEHELCLPVSNDEWKRNWENARSCIARFYEAGWPERARRIPADSWLPVDALDTFLLDGVTVYAAPDFALRENGRLIIVDWKTGTPREEDQKQVQCYVLFAADKWNAPTGSITARLVYLGSGDEIDVAVDDAALEDFKVHFRKSVADMKACLRDPDANTACIEDFPMTENTASCCGCPFRRLCGRG